MQAADTISVPTVPTANLAERMIKAMKDDEMTVRMSLPRMCRIRLSLVIVVLALAASASSCSRLSSQRSS
jgi:hypothetical protein